MQKMLHILLSYAYFLMYLHDFFTYFPYTLRVKMIEGSIL